MTQGGTGAGARDAPSGEVTFLFTDLESSTALWEDHPENMRAALEIHDRRLRAAFARRGGYVFTTAGDSFAVAFVSATDALAAAIDAQRALIEPCGEMQLRIRVGLHTGTASRREGDYFGAAVNRCARVASVGHGGQILVSGATRRQVASSLDSGPELVDLGQHRLKDLREPEHVFEVRHPDLASGFPPLRSLDDSWSNLPVQLTDLIGRSDEIAEVRRLLGQSRLVTLLGSGGSGKTRLALQVAADALADHPGGTRVVELTPIADPSRVADELAEHVGAPRLPDTPLVTAIASRIGSRKLLLVLDNCEHLVDAVAELTGDLLRACTGLRVLATSQQALDVSGEVRYRVPSLGLPERADPGAAAESAAVQLFVERAIAVRPDFAFGDDNADAVVSICHRLDGIPLALELAAARVRMLSPAEIADRLVERFHLLGGGQREAPSRHRTLRAAMEWSHAMLSEDERVLFRRLSAFVGDFTLDAAATVGDGDPYAVLDVLGSLVDKSLVIPEATPDATRYRMLETIREYGSEQLELSGEAHDVRARHAAHYVAIAEELYTLRRKGEVRAAIDGYERDEDDIRIALRHTLDTGDVESTARIIGGVGHIWYLEGTFREGIEWCRELFDRDPDLPDELLVRPLHVYGTLLGSWRQPQAGVAMIRRETELLRRLDEPKLLAEALNNLGNLLNDLGRPDEGDECLREAIEQFRIAGESPAIALASLGMGYLQRGTYDEAEVAFSEALTEARTHGDDYAVALSLVHLGQCALVADGDLEQARELIAAGAELFADLAVAPAAAECEMLLGLVEREAGDRPAAAAHFLTALEVPDAHWYLATKYWILQFVAGLLVDDPAVAGRLLATVGAQYDRVDEDQPAWVLEDLRQAQRRVHAADSGTPAGTPSAVRELDVEAAISLARAALGRLAAAKPSAGPTAARDAPI